MYIIYHFYSIFSNNFPNRKYKRRQKKSIEFPKFNIIDEKISLTEHSNILNEYQEELKFLALKRKNPDSLENSQIFKEVSTRDSDIIICVDNNIEDQNSEEKEFKSKNLNIKNENNIDIFNLINLNNSLFNKIGSNFKKVSNFVEMSKIDKQKNNFIQETGKSNFKKVTNNKVSKNSLLNYLINRFYHSNFAHGNLEKLIEKINNIIINNNNEKINCLENSFNSDFNNENNFIHKKDKFSYLNLLNENLNKNYISSLSLTSNNDFIKTIIYISNKCSIKGETIENNLTKLLEQSHELLNKLKNKNHNEAENFDLNLMKNVIYNKEIRKRLKLNFRFLKYLNKNVFSKFLIDENNLENKFGSLINNKKDEHEYSKKFFKKLGKPGYFNCFILLYFLLGAIYINNSNITLSENELFSLIPYFMLLKKKKSNKLNKRKKMKLKKVSNNVLKNNNIIRINLEDI